MKTNIDTIRKALKLALDLSSRSATSKIYKSALAALSTIDPDAKPQEPSEDIDSLIEQLDEVLASESDDASPSHRLVYLDPDKAVALITAHDDAIRRKCAEKNCEVCEHEYEQTLCGGTIKNPRRPDHCKFRAAILATEPARECKTCNGTGVIIESHGSPYGSETLNCPACTEPAREDA